MTIPARGWLVLRRVTGKRVPQHSFERNRAGIIALEASGAGIGTTEQPRRHESRREMLFRLNRAVRLDMIAA